MLRVLLKTSTGEQWFSSRSAGPFKINGILFRLGLVQQILGNLQADGRGRFRLKA